MMWKIESVADVREFFRHLTEERSVNFHPDDPFDCYVERDTGKPTFTPEECLEYDAAMQRCFEVCEREGEDIYLIGIDELWGEW